MDSSSNVICLHPPKANLRRTLAGLKRILVWIMTSATILLPSFYDDLSHYYASALSRFQLTLEIILLIGMIFSISRTVCVIYYTHTHTHTHTHTQSSVQFSHSVMSDSLRPHGLQYTRLLVHHQQLPKRTQLMSIESVMPSNHLILCHPLLLLPSIFPTFKVFSSESFLCIGWPKYWNFSFSISPSN